MMYSEDFLQNIIKTALMRGGEYCDVFIEERDDTVLSLDNGKVKNISTGITAGVGIRVIYGTNSVYTYSSNPDEKLINDLAHQTAKAVNLKKKGNLGEFTKQVARNIIQVKIIPETINLSQKVELLNRANNAARAYSNKIQEVLVQYLDNDQKVLIANSEGNFVEDRRIRTRFTVNAIAQDGEAKETGFNHPGRAMGWEFFDLFAPEDIAKEAARIACIQLDADYAPQGSMPVIIDNEFGGVIFHEACGHALETTSVANNASVFCGKHNEVIASEIVSAFDDGTIKNSWGSADFDDEGNPTRRNQLIKDGVLTSYMVDKLGSIKMDLPITGNARRESYKFAPTSRMTNTFIAQGNHSLNEMISSIDTGLYCKTMGGGCVHPATTDFSFSVSEAYLIKNGHIDKPVKQALLIGKGTEILKNIEMIGNNIDTTGTGMCGSSSGSVPACVGQPAIKVMGLVVGGRN